MKLNITFPIWPLLLALVAFVVLKLAGVIAWPWVWVCAPVWIPLLIGLLAVLVVLVVAWFGQVRKL